MHEVPTRAGDGTWQHGRAEGFTAAEHASSYHAAVTERGEPSTDPSPANGGGETESTEHAGSSARAGDPGPPEDTDTLAPDQRVIPSWTQTIARQASTAIGGPLGRHAAVGRHWFLSPLRVVLGLAVLALILAWGGKAACIQSNQQGTGLDWSGHRQYVAMCYSDIVPLYGTERLDKGAFPYRDSWQQTTTDKSGRQVTEQRYMEYPVLTGMFQWVNAKLTHAWDELSERGIVPTALPVAVYFDASALLLGLAWLITVWAVTRTARRRPWDAALAAISPLVLVHAFTNFDTLATAFAATGLLAWSRRRPVLAGILLGLGGATKLYPLFLLLPILLLCARTGRWRPGLHATAAAAGTWLAVNLPFAVAFGPGWAQFFRLNATRVADPDSIYNVLSGLTGWSGFSSVDTLNSVAAVLLVLACVAIGWLALAAPSRPRLAQLCFLLVAAFLLTNKVWSPQYSLWLVPLAVLALPNWKVLLGWMVIDALVWAPRMFMYLEQEALSAHDPDRGLPPQWFLGTVAVRDLAVLGLCALIVHHILHPRTDPVRISGDDDPAGGPFVGRPDRLRVPSLPQLLPGKPNRNRAGPSRNRAG